MSGILTGTVQLNDGVTVCTAVQGGICYFYDKGIVGGLLDGLVERRIIKEGVVLSDQVLKLDALLTHQVDPALIMDMGREFAARFKESGVTKVVTLESSGISVAFAAALELGVPMVFARRKNAARRSRRLV